MLTCIVNSTGGVVGPHYASSKSALHGLIHWLSGAYCNKGITVNGVAPALIENTAMLPGGSEELKASKFKIRISFVLVWSGLVWVIPQAGAVRH